MIARNRTRTVLTLFAVAMTSIVSYAAAKKIPAQLPDPDGKAPTVDTRDYWRSVELSPSAQGYHYNRNVETYMFISDALGLEMVKLMKQQK